MKKITIFLALLLQTTMILKSQDHNYNEGQIATTMEIYNYVTKGYAIQQASGLDMKKGYFIWEKTTKGIQGSDGKKQVKINALVSEDGYYSGTVHDSAADGSVSETPAFVDYKVCAWMLIYQENDAAPKYFCIPTQASSEEVWNQAFKDLRDAKLSTNAYLAYSWALYNLVGMMTNDYLDICFRSSTKIMMADGSQKAIETIRPGDSIMSYDYFMGQAVVSRVAELIEHSEKEYPICKITLLNENAIVASIQNELAIITIDATANHPFVTKSGIKTIGELTLSDKILSFDKFNNSFHDLPILRIDLNNSTEGKVYNIRLDNNMTFIANGLVVLMK